MDYLRKLNIICLSIQEIEKMFKTYLNFIGLKKIFQNGYSIEVLKKDNKKSQEIINEMVGELLKNKEDIEIFEALYLCSTYYKSKVSKICFELKNNIVLNRIQINSLDELKKVIKEESLTDFALWSSDGIRQFQLKQYKGNLQTGDLFKFITKKLRGYGNDLGDTNLLIVLQGKQGGYDCLISYIDFKELFEKILMIGLKFKAQILIVYNEENRFCVINQIYPKLITSRRELN